MSSKPPEPTVPRTPEQRQALEELQANVAREFPTAKRGRKPKVEGRKDAILFIRADDALTKDLDELTEQLRERASLVTGVPSTLTRADVARQLLMEGLAARKAKPGI